MKKEKKQKYEDGSIMRNKWGDLRIIYSTHDNDCYFIEGRYINTEQLFWCVPAHMAVRETQFISDWKKTGQLGKKELESIKNIVSDFHTAISSLRTDTTMALYTAMQKYNGGVIPDID